MGTCCAKHSTNNGYINTRSIIYVCDGVSYVKRKGDNTSSSDRITDNDVHKFSYSQKDLVNSRYIVYYDVLFFYDINIQYSSIISHHHIYHCLIHDTGSNNILILNESKAVIYCIDFGTSGYYTTCITVKPTHDTLKEFDMNDVIQHVKIMR
jgi:hypothetical protein